MPARSCSAARRWLAPRVELIGGGEADDNSRIAAQARLQTWIEAEIARKLPSHHGLRHGEAAKTLEGLARGLAFRIMETGAAIDLREDDPGHRIEAEQREALRAVGIRAGRVSAHAPDAQKPAPQKLISVLRTVFDDGVCPPAPEGAGSFPVTEEWSDGALAANGYLRFGKRAVRADLAERLAWEVAKRRKDAGKNLFALPAELASVVSCPGDEFPDVVKGLGLVPAEKDPETGTPTLWRYGGRGRPDGPPPRQRREGGGRPPRTQGQDRPREGGKRPRPERGGKGGGKPPRRDHSPARRIDPDSPFAALAVLLPDEKPKKQKRKPKKKNRDKPAAPSSGFTYTPFQ